MQIADFQISSNIFREDIIFREKYSDVLNNNDSQPESIRHTGVYLTDGSAFTLGVNKEYELLSEIEEKEVLGHNMQRLEEEGYYDRSVSLLVLKHKAPVTIEQKSYVLVNMLSLRAILSSIRLAISFLWSQLFIHEKSVSKSSRGWRVCSPSPLSPILLLPVKPCKKILTPRAVQVATFDSTVLILGETGVGKEVIAEFIHQFSNRRNKPLIKVSASGIPEGLLESELFGYRAGAFTGALKSAPKIRPGSCRSRGGDSFS